MAPPQSPTNAEESFFHTSFQDIGKKLKACNDTLGELQQLGVSHDVQLPELVLVGDQSAGKSSLMSGLANLDLPRSDGTCTRCPLHIRVSRHADWSCRVSLRKDYTYDPPADDRPIREEDVTAQDPFFPWKRQPKPVMEFKTMHDKSEIEEVLRWAQIAILNDDMQPELYVPGSGNIAMSKDIEAEVEDTTAKFSPNVVSLEIRGPELPDLSFYDMPGIFQNPADARDDYLVNVVRNLSMEYIGHPSAIILCSMPMNSDAENSCTFGLIRRLEASHRTIGVLTKADLLPQSGKHEQWLSIMKGEAHQTGLGYFITSRPHDKNLDYMLEWEEKVFEHHLLEWWPESFHQFGNRCGVEKLKAFLSERLAEAFAHK
jgi:GTPase SAR1 family protein